MSRPTRGEVVAKALWRSWRSSPPHASLTVQEWQEVTPLLLRTGAAGLGWWRMRAAGLPAVECAGDLRDAYRIQTLDARLREGRLGEILEVLEAEDMPVLISKGWSVAARYPALGLRPYGDFDLHVPPDLHTEAGRALRAAELESRVDLHPGVPRLAEEWPELWRRSRPAGLDGTSLRVLGDEDHLRLLCSHFLEHGAWRPLWLCDVALLVEEVGDGLDWGFAAGRGPLGERVRVVAMLAHRLLGADLRRTPWSELDASSLPRWVTSSTLGAWSVGGHYSLTTRIAFTEADPVSVARALRIRWPNPIEATIRAGASFNHLPRLPYQVLDALSRLGRALPASARLIAQRGVRRVKHDGAASEMPVESDPEPDPQAQLRTGLGPTAHEEQQ